MKNKKSIILILGILVTVGLASAAYILTASTTITGAVTSDGQSILTFSLSNDDLGIIDSSLGATTTNSTNTINNLNGELNMLVDFKTIIIDVEDDCNNTGDINLSLFLGDLELFDGDTFTLPAGTSNVHTIVDTVAHSCPQSFNTSISFIEV